MAGKAYPLHSLWRQRARQFAPRQNAYFARRRPRKVNQLLAESLPSGLFATTFTASTTLKPNFALCQRGSLTLSGGMAKTSARLRTMECHRLGSRQRTEDVEVKLSRRVGLHLYGWTIEALNPRREMYGFEAAQKTSNTSVNPSAPTNWFTSPCAMDTFVEGAHQQDDAPLWCCVKKPKRQTSPEVSGARCDRVVLKYIPPDRRESLVRKKPLQTC